VGGDGEARVAEESLGRRRAAAEGLEDARRSSAAAERQDRVTEAVARGAHGGVVIEARLLKRPEAVGRKHLHAPRGTRKLSRTRHAEAKPRGS
jgi:hypothetical protein